MENVSRFIATVAGEAGMLVPLPGVFIVISRARWAAFLIVDPLLRILLVAGTEAHSVENDLTVLVVVLPTARTYGRVEVFKLCPVARLVRSAGDRDRS